MLAEVGGEGRVGGAAGTPPAIARRGPGHRQARPRPEPSRRRPRRPGTPATPPSARACAPGPPACPPDEPDGPAAGVPPEWAVAMVSAAYAAGPARSATRATAAATVATRRRPAGSSVAGTATTRAAATVIARIAIPSPGTKAGSVEESHAGSLGRRLFRTGYEAGPSSARFAERPRPADRQAGAARRLVPPSSGRPSRGRSRRRSRVPGRRRAPVVDGAVEAVEDAVALVRRDARGRNRPPSRSTRLPSAARTSTVPASGAYLHALSSSTPRSRSSQSGGIGDHVAARGGRGPRGQAPRLRDDREAVGGLPRRARRGPRAPCPARPRSGVEAGQPEHVLQEPPHPLGLAVDALEGARGTSSASRSLREGQGRVGLDHGERRPQLVRGIGGELQLAPAGGLDRRRDAPADDHGADEHEDRAGTGR